LAEVISGYFLNILYTKEALHEIQSAQTELCEKLDGLNGRLVAILAPKLKEMHAREYLQHGLCRRLKIISKSLRNIFEIFPPDRTDRLQSEELEDIQINLHAFFINVYGSLENIAWIYALENKIKPLTDSPLSISLFKKETTKFLNNELRNYLNSNRIKKWFTEYAKNYRDALAHRIPLYVPPFSLNPSEVEQFKELELQIKEAFQNLDFELIQKLESEKDKLGSISGTFLHSFSHDKSRPVALHPQLIADASTVFEIADLFSKNHKVNN